MTSYINRELWEVLVEADKYQIKIGDVNITAVPLKRIIRIDYANLSITYERDSMEPFNDYIIVSLNGAEIYNIDKFLLPDINEYYFQLPSAETDDNVIDLGGGYTIAKNGDVEYLQFIFKEGDKIIFDNYRGEYRFYINDEMALVSKNCHYDYKPLTFVERSAIERSDIECSD